MGKGHIYAGIDIGTEKICTVIVNRSEESGNVNVIGVASVESKGLRKSQIVDLEETIASITECVEAAERMAGYNISEALVSVSGSHIESINSKGVVAVAEPEGEIKSTDVDRVIEAARAIALPSSREIIHVLPRDFSVDAQGGIKDPIGMTGVRLEAEAHIISGAATALKNTHKCLYELGINLGSLVFSGLASSLAVLSDTEKELGVACIDIGAGTTSLAVYVEGSLSYSAVIPVGARNITNDLAIGMRVSLTSAEKIKLYLSQSESEGTPPLNAKASEIAKFKKDFDTLDFGKLGLQEEVTAASRRSLIDGIIRPRLKEIFILIGEQLKNANVLDQIPAGLVITGGGSQTVSILDVAKRTLSVPARIGEPKGLSGLVEELASPSYAAATGLIHYAIKNSHEIKPINPRSPGITSKFKNLPIKQTYHQLIDFIKSLLPG